MKKMKLEEMLTITATEYCAMKGTRPENYSAVGIRFKSDDTDCDCVDVPDGTEAVVDYKHELVRIRGIGACALQVGHGTALIPKSIKEAKIERPAPGYAWGSIKPANEYPDDML